MTPPETCAKVLQFVNSSSRRGLAQDCLQGSGRSLPPRGNGVGYTILWWLLIVCISCVCWLLVGYLIGSMLHLGFQQLWLHHCLWLRGVVIFLPAGVLLFFVVKSCMSRLVVLIK